MINRMATIQQLRRTRAMKPNPSHRGFAKNKRDWVLEALELTEKATHQPGSQNDVGKHPKEKYMQISGLEQAS